MATLDDALLLAIGQQTTDDDVIRPYAFTIETPDRGNPSDHSKSKKGKGQAKEASVAAQTIQAYLFLDLKPLEQPVRHRRQKKEDKDRGINSMITAFDAENYHGLHVVVVTHGAGGNSLSPANACLCRGIASGTVVNANRLVVLAFDGKSSNPKSRAKALIDVLGWVAKSERVTCITLAGRSLGCRASAIAYNEIVSSGVGIGGKLDGSSTKSKERDRESDAMMERIRDRMHGKLVLESYPLVGGGPEARRQVLVDLHEHTRVLFIIGTEDSMAPRQAIDRVRSPGSMRSSRNFLLAVEGLDHGMSMVGKVHGASKKVAAEALGLAAGKIAGEWTIVGASSAFVRPSSSSSSSNKKTKVDDGALQSSQLFWEDNQVLQSPWQEDDLAQVQAAESNPPSKIKQAGETGKSTWKHKETAKSKEQAPQGKKRTAGQATSGSSSKKPKTTDANDVASEAGESRQPSAKAETPARKSPRRKPA